MLALVNIISRLMQLYFEIPLPTGYYTKTTGYCYNSVNVITFGLAQSDRIKLLLLYFTIFRRQSVPNQLQKILFTP
jgi:hypothetical protein